MGRTAGLPYKFVFYLRQKKRASKEGGNQTQTGTVSPLQRVALTLPPPVSDSHTRQAMLLLALIDICMYEINMHAAQFIMKMYEYIYIILHPVVVIRLGLCVGSVGIVYQ